MITKPLKYAIIALLFIVLVIVVMYAYRIFFLFKKDKIKAYATEAANKTALPDLAYKMLIEACQNILKSEDLTAQVKLLADIDKIDKEKALVITALNNCYSSGMIGREQPETVSPAQTLPNV